MCLSLTTRTLHPSKGGEGSNGSWRFADDSAHTRLETLQCRMTGTVSEIAPGDVALDPVYTQYKCLIVNLWRRRIGSSMHYKCLIVDI